MTSQFLAVVVILLLLFFVIKPKRNLVGGSGESMFTAPTIISSGNSSINLVTIIITVIFLVGIIYMAINITSSGNTLI